MTLALVAAVVLLTAPPVFAQTPASSRDATPAVSPWLDLTPIPRARSEFAAAAIGTRIYVAGGFGSDARFDRLDTETGEWHQLAHLPEEIHHPGVTALEGRVYVAGGYRVGDMRAVGMVWAYDTTRDVWERQADLPTPRGAFGLVALDGRLYAVGGARVELGGPVTGAVEAYDPATNAWQRLAELSTPREHLAVVALGERIYAIGGRANGAEGDEFASANEVYDPATNHWNALAPLSLPRGGLAGVAVAGQVVVLGGERGQTTFADVDAFDPATNTWIALPAMPTARHGLAAAVVGDAIYAIAGSTRAGTVENTPVVEALPLGAWQEERA